MQLSPYRRSLLALAFSACGAAAHAQQDCQQQIAQLEQQIQQQQMNQERQTELRELLEAARENPAECASYVSRAQQTMQQGTQTPTEQSVATGETTIVPIGEPSSTVSKSRQESAAPPATAADPAPAPVPEERLAEVREPGVDLQDLRGRPALSSDGEEIGEVQDFVRSTTDGGAHALIAVGGVLGIGTRTLAVPLDRVAVTRDGALETELSAEALEAQPEYDEQQYRPIPETELAALEAELESKPR